MDDHSKIYEEFFEHAMHLLNDEQKEPELIAGTMMAIAQRIYRTQLNEEEYLLSNPTTSRKRGYTELGRIQKES